VVTLGALWQPIVLSAVLVFITSSLIHMVLRYHASDYKQLPNEDAVRAAIRAGSPEPRQYIIPYCKEMKDMESPEMKQKLTEGPVAVLNVKRPGVPSMTTNLVQWFVFSLVISLFVAYAAAHSLQRGDAYLHVFRVVGTVAWLGYAGGQVPSAIWMGKPWPVAWKEVFDGLIYGLMTAGAFWWLWPRP
jgi:hypothetical protein